MFGRREKGFDIASKSSTRVRETIAATTGINTKTHYVPYTFPGGNRGYAIRERSYFERYTNLKVITSTVKNAAPINIENLLQTFQRNQEIPVSIEAVFLHALISNAENGQSLSRKKTDKIEKVIVSAFLDGVKTVAQTAPDGKVSIFLPFTEQFAQYARAKMIQVQTNSTLATEDVIQRAYSVTRIPQVMDALRNISDHAVTLKQNINDHGEFVTITDARGNEYHVDIKPESQNKTEGSFDSDIAKAYAESRHGVDGRLMDPDVARVLEIYAPGKTIADIGMGAGPVAMDAIKAGAAKVYGLDNSQAMLDRANEAITKAESEGTIPPRSIQTILGSAEDLPNPPYQDNSAGLVLSINVGCALPSEGIFAPHFLEMARIATPDGKILVTAPTTFGEVFTSGKLSKEDVLKKIGQTLIEVNQETFGKNEDIKIKQLRKKMGNLAEVNRATFVLRSVEGAEKQFVLVYDGEVPEELKTITIRESALKRGEPIERKLAGGVNTTGLVVPNFYHPREEYLEAIRDAGLTIVGGTPIHNVMTQKELSEYNTSLPPERQLGQEYFANSPFDIYLLTK